MALLELLRKVELDQEIDFLREGVRPMAAADRRASRAATKESPSATLATTVPPDSSTIRAIPPG